MSESSGASSQFGGSKIVCDMDDHGTMKSDALKEAQSAVEKFTQEKGISRHIKVNFHIFILSIRKRDLTI